MSSSNGSVVIDKDGHPAGFLETVDELKTIKVHMIDDGIVTITLARPYRNARTTNEAMDEIIAGAGTQFDPEVVTAFVAMLGHRNRVARTA